MWPFFLLILIYTGCYELTHNSNAADNLKEKIEK
jgi:hypothetical protein